MNGINWKTPLLIGLMGILMGCLQTSQIKPTKPTLQIFPQKDGGICLDRQNAIELGTYILELENNYGN